MMMSYVERATQFPIIIPIKIFGMPFDLNRFPKLPMVDVIYLRDNYSQSRSQILKAFHKACKAPRVKPARDDPISKVHLMYIQGSTDRISHILKKINFSYSFKPLNTIKNSLRSIGDPIDPKELKGVYLVPSSCSILYIGEIGRSIKQRINAHAANLRHNCSLSSALAEHAEKSNHHAHIEESKVITNVVHFHDMKLSEVIEIERHTINLNWDDGWKLSKSWIPMLSS